MLADRVRRQLPIEGKRLLVDLVQPSVLRRGRWWRLTELTEPRGAGRGRVPLVPEPPLVPHPRLPGQRVRDVLQTHPLAPLLDHAGGIAAEQVGVEHDPRLAERVDDLHGLAEVRPPGLLVAEVGPPMRQRPQRRRGIAHEEAVVEALQQVGPEQRGRLVGHVLDEHRTLARRVLDLGQDLLGRAVGQRLRVAGGPTVRAEVVGAGERLVEDHVVPSLHHHPLERGRHGPRDGPQERDPVTHGSSWMGSRPHRMSDGGRPVPVSLRAGLAVVHPVRARPRPGRRPPARCP